MSIANIIEDLTLPGELYTLQVKAPTTEEDDNGDLKYTWQDVQDLIGIIQKPATDPFGIQGSEEEAKYLGLFEPNFELPDNELGNYRIKHTFPSITPFIRYFDISEIDRNLRFENEIDHYELQLTLSHRY